MKKMENIIPQTESTNVQTKNDLSFLDSLAGMTLGELNKEQIE